MATKTQSKRAGVALRPEALKPSVRVYDDFTRGNTSNFEQRSIQ